MTNYETAKVVELMSNNANYVGVEYECYNTAYAYLNTIEQEIKENKRGLENEELDFSWLEELLEKRGEMFSKNEEISPADIWTLNKRILKLVYNYHKLETRIKNNYRKCLDKKTLWMDLYASTPDRAGLFGIEEAGLVEENDIIVVAEFYMDTNHPQFNNYQDKYAGRDTFKLETLEQVEEVTY